MAAVSRRRTAQRGKTPNRVADLEALGEAVLDLRAPAELIAWLQQRGDRR